MDLGTAKLILEDALSGGGSAVAEGTRVICDTTSFKLTKAPETVTESKTGRKYTRLTGLIQKADTPNENGRIYPVGVMKEALDELKERIVTRTVLGELDHPDDAKVHTENCCILLTKVWMENLNVYGEFEVLEDLPKGKILKALIDQNVTVSISSRGVGDMEIQLREDGTEVNEVLPGFRFVCFDAVNEPSVRGTKLNMMESKQRQDRVNVRRKAESQLAGAMREFLK